MYRKYWAKHGAISDREVGLRSARVAGRTFLALWVLSDETAASEDSKVYMCLRTTVEARK
jgi:hypothetical protein